MSTNTASLVLWNMLVSPGSNIREELKEGVKREMAKGGAKINIFKRYVAKVITI